MLMYVKKDLKSFHRQSISMPNNWPFMMEERKRIATMNNKLIDKTHRNSVMMKGTDETKARGSVKVNKLTEHIKRKSLFQFGLTNNLQSLALKSKLQENQQDQISEEED